MRVKNLVDDSFRNSREIPTLLKKSTIDFYFQFVQNFTFVRFLD